MSANVLHICVELIIIITTTNTTTSDHLAALDVLVYLWTSPSGASPHTRTNTLAAWRGASGVIDASWMHGRRVQQLADLHTLHGGRSGQAKCDAGEMTTTATQSSCACSAQANGLAAAAGAASGAMRTSHRRLARWSERT